MLFAFILWPVIALDAVIALTCVSDIGKPRTVVTPDTGVAVMVHMVLVTTGLYVVSLHTHHLAPLLALGVIGAYVLGNGLRVINRVGREGSRHTPRGAVIGVVLTTLQIVGLLYVMWHH